MTCGTDVTYPQSAIQTCGCHSVQYTGGFILNRVALPPVASERETRAAFVLVHVAFPTVKLEVSSPPPRLALR
jgi:hypothetical protein